MKLTITGYKHYWINLGGLLVCFAHYQIFIHLHCIRKSGDTWLVLAEPSLLI